MLNTGVYALENPTHNSLEIIENDIVKQSIFEIEHSVRELFENIKTQKLLTDDDSESAFYNGGIEALEVVLEMIFQTKEKWGLINYDD